MPKMATENARKKSEQAREKTKHIRYIIAHQFQANLKSPI